jgi:hypothetical protein
MPHFNEFFARHGFEFWTVSTLLALYPFLASIGAFLSALPAGISKAIRYQRESRLERLQAYADDKTRIFRYILGQVCVNLFVMSWWTVHSTDRLFRAASPGGSLSDLVINLFSEVGAIYVLLAGLIDMIGFNAALTLLTLWTFRDPEGQIMRIRKRLNMDTPVPTVTESGVPLPPT